MNKLRTLNRLKKELALRSLFLPGRTCTSNAIWRKKIRYDLGKYKPALKNTEINVTTPIWYTIQKEGKVKYLALWCIDERSLTDTEKEYYVRLKEVYNRETGDKKKE